MKKHVYTADIQRLRFGLNMLGLTVVANPTPEFNRAISCYLYRNLDGTIRWLWPVSADQPDFLRFYHNGSRRARLFAWTVRALFFLKLPNWVAHDQLTLYTNTCGYQWFRRAQINRWALFTGTAGPNRTLVAWYATHQQESFFAKVALAGSALLNLRQDALALEQMQELGFLKLDVPRLKAYDQGVLVQEDFDSVTAWQANRFAELPTAALFDQGSQRWRTQPLYPAPKTMTDLQHDRDTRIPVGQLDKLDQLMHRVKQLPLW